LKMMQLKIPLKKKQLHFMFMKDSGVLPRYVYNNRLLLFLLFYSKI
jgi:hypothetical protein